MPVVNPIIFKVTEAGRDAAAYAFNNLPGGKLSLSAIKVGLAKYSTVGNETALQNPLPNTFSIGGGGVQVGSGQIRFTPILASLTRIEAFEIGLFTETGILFAVAATPTNIPLLVIEPDIEAIFTMNVALTNVDPDSIEIVVDVNAPLAVVMMGQHISAAHPHSQYKRTNDASERLKVANGVDNDEAVSKGQLDGAINTEAGIRANADDALQTAINNEATARSNADTALQNSKADLAGSSTQTFSVAVATANDHAVRKEQLDGAISTEAGIRANADDALQTAINGKANTAGSSTQTFSVAAATANDHAVRKDQFDAKTGIATDIVAGIVEKATQAEMNAGTNNVWPDAATLLNGFSQSSSSIRLPEWLGGWLIQWGYTQVGDVGVSNDLSTTVFTTTYVSQPHVMVSGWTDAGNSSFSVNVRSVTTGSFVAILAEWNEVIQSNNTGYNWLAIGK